MQEATVDLALGGVDLQRFEQEITDNKGVWLYFDRVPPSEDEAAAKGGKAPPGKPGAKPGATTEELKPVNGKVWIDLTSFGDPSQPSQLVRQRFPIQTIIKAPSEGASEANPTYTVFEPQNTYIMISLHLQD